MTTNLNQQFETKLAEARKALDEYKELARERDVRLAQLLEELKKNLN
jgi:hypothetical protein